MFSTVNSPSQEISNIKFMRVFLGKLYSSLSGLKFRRCENCNDERTPTKIKGGSEMRASSGEKLNIVGIELRLDFEM